MFRQLLQAAHRWWDSLRHGPEVRRLARRVQKLEASSKESESRWETHQEALKKASASRHRRVLSPDIVRGLLPLRTPTIRSRATDANAASADARLIEVSSAYAEALASGQTPADGLVRTDLQGLTWWVPIPASLTGAARERFLAKQRFPYRNITQTREFAQGPVMLDIGANTGRMSIPRVIRGDFMRA